MKYSYTQGSIPVSIRDIVLEKSEFQKVLDRAIEEALHDLYLDIVVGPRLRPGRREYLEIPSVRKAIQMEQIKRWVNGRAGKPVYRKMR